MYQNDHEYRRPIGHYPRRKRPAIYKPQVGWLLTTRKKWKYYEPDGASQTKQYNKFLPADFGIAEKASVLFIRAHFANKVAKMAELSGFRGQFEQDSLKSGRFGLGDIDSQWPSTVQQDFMR